MDLLQRKGMYPLPPGASEILGEWSVGFLVEGEGGGLFSDGLGGRPGGDLWLRLDEGSRKYRSGRDVWVLRSIG